VSRRSDSGACKWIVSFQPSRPRSERPGTLVRLPGAARPSGTGRRDGRRCRRGRSNTGRRCEARGVWRRPRLRRRVGEPAVSYETVQGRGCGGGWYARSRVEDERQEPRRPDRQEAAHPLAGRDAAARPAGEPSLLARRRRRRRSCGTHSHRAGARRARRRSANRRGRRRGPRELGCGQGRQQRATHSGRGSGARDDEVFVVALEAGAGAVADPRSVE